MAGELAALRAVVSSTVKFVLGRSPDEILRGEVVDKPLGQNFGQWGLRLEWPGARIYDILLRPHLAGPDWLTD
jgi:hypothetical protein